MSLNSLHKIFTDSRVWLFLAITILAVYLLPLFYPTFYTPTFDNLDSNIVWNKILAESGKIFASNSETIPNMMNSLPRASYGSEFEFILWLYYFFEPKTAFIINEVLIHIIAFLSAFIFLKSYIVKQNRYYCLVPVFVGSIYFSILPFWSGAGVSIAILPLITYSLLNIKNSTDNKLDWILIFLIPLYTSFVFLYVFYILIAGVYWLYIAIRDKNLYKRLFLAIFLMGVLFLLKEYRLVLVTFIDKSFISHRTEFEIFFTENLKETYRLWSVKFVEGHIPHAISSQIPYILPIILIGLLLTFSRKRFDEKESIIIYLIIIASFIVDLWDKILFNSFLIPSVMVVSILSIVFGIKRYSLLPKLILLLLLLTLISSLFEYEGFSILMDVEPFFRSFNMSRVYFVEPLIYLSLFVVALIIFIRKLSFTLFILPVFVLFYTIDSYDKSFYQTYKKDGYGSFEEYYSINNFNRLKRDFGDEIKKFKFVSYGLEPAVTLYNGLYTIDGYSTNYPLEYKHKFHKIFKKYGKTPNYDKWGSKIYIASVSTYYETYLSLKARAKKIILDGLRFETKEICKLGGDYMLSPYLFKNPKEKNLKLIKSYKDNKRYSWDIYLYRVECDKL